MKASIAKPDKDRNRVVEVMASDIISSEEPEEDQPDEYPDYFPMEVIDELRKSGAVNILEKREDIRGRLALIYLIATFSMFLLGFVVAILDAQWRGTSIVENLAQ